MLIRISKSATMSFIVGLMALITLLGASSCKLDKGIPTYEKAEKKDSSNGWVSWNFLFPPNTTAAERNAVMISRQNEIRAYLNGRLDRRSPAVGRQITFKIDSCICDSLLYMMNADIKIWGTTGSTTTPPNPPPTKPSGEALVDDNDRISIPEDTVHRLITTSQLKVPSPKISSVRLAVLDTGIDTTLFLQGGINRLLWKPRDQSINNFLVGADPINFTDDHRGRHGSAVTSIILRQIDREGPSLMILKVLDAHGVGSVFTLSCALSYTAQNKAQLINGSLGYYGKLDSILNKYIDRNTDSGNHVIAAAGNVGGAHPEPDWCKLAPNTNGLLQGSRLFYPACFSGSASTKNLISVTGIAELEWPCYFQNYSKSYVDLGVLNGETRCCFYNVNFLNKIEGSSFATPVVTGKIGNFFIRNGRSDFSRNQILTGIGVQTGANRLTIGGKYINE